MDEQNENKNQLGEAAKKAAKKKIMQKIKPFLIKVIVFAAIILFAAVLVLGIVEAVVEVVESVITTIVDFFTIDAEGAIVADENAISSITNTIAEQDVDLEGLYLEGEDDPNEYIKKFFEAQAVTQTIYTANGDTKSDKMYGTIHIYKTDNEDEANSESGKELTYVEYSKMEKMKEDNDEDIGNYFSINEDKLVYAVITKETKKYTKKEGNSTVKNTTDESTRIDLREIDYKSVVSQYTTPMTFFMYLSMVTQNPEFVSAVVDLVEQGEIKIMLLNDTTTCTSTETHTSTENTVPLTDDEPPQEGTKETKTIEEKTTITTVNESPSVAIVHVKTWFCEQKITYDKNEGEKIISQGEKIKDGEDDSKPKITQKAKDAGKIVWYTNKYVKYDSETQQTKYEQGVYEDAQYIGGEKGDPGIEDKNDNDKVDKDEKVDENTTFVGLLDNKFKIPKKSEKSRYEEAGSNLVDGAELFFQLLQKDPELQNLEQIMRYILYKYTGKDYGVTEFDFSIFNAKEFKTFGGKKLSPFGTNLSREEFINAVKAYNGGSSYYKLSNAAGDFYDVCTSEKYNVNPTLAFAWACIETGWGKSTPNNNLFGFAIYNGANSGASYSNYSQSIEDFCKWILNTATPNTNSYNFAYSTSQQYATVNSNFSGTPDENIYALFSNYMNLGNTHICDEPNFSNPAGTNYYISHGSTWGAGGRVHIYTMYETGSYYGLYDNEYAIRCGHSKGSDLTTLQERADYVQYSLNSRIKVAKNIFGDNCFISSGGSLVETAYMVADHFLNSGVNVHYAADSNPDAKHKNGRICVFGDINANWELPVKNPTRYGIVCATYVSLAIWQAGLIDEDTINQYGFNSCTGIVSMLTTSSYSNQWQKIVNRNDLQEGDIVFYDGHVLIYVGEGKAIDQNYCAITSGGNDYRGNLVNVDNRFIYAYRYIGN